MFGRWWEDATLACPGGDEGVVRHGYFLTVVVSRNDSDMCSDIAGIAAHLNSNLMSLSFLGNAAHLGGVLARKEGRTCARRGSGYVGRWKID